MAVKARALINILSLLSNTCLNQYSVLAFKTHALINILSLLSNTCLESILCPCFQTGLRGAKSLGAAKGKGSLGALAAGGAASAGQEDDPLYHHGFMIGRGVCAHFVCLSV